ncbi:MAG TPA: polysaccharide deacetylase family protein [Gaiellaceae bacterium]|nr:polysaccharide deacetylase family protein [Gaiellaceae bacterium]
MDARGALRRTVLAAARTRAFEGIVAALERVARERPDVLAVLTYHRIDVSGRAPLLYPGLISAEPDGFEEQMRFLASRWRPLSLVELVAVRRGETRLPARSVMVTFDDAYTDFGEVAWPILARYGIPATLFVPTAYPGDRGLAFWWDRLYGALAAAPSRAPLASPIGRIELATDGDRLQAFRRLRSHLKSLPHERAQKLVGELCRELDGPAPASAVLTWPELRRLHAEGVALAPHSRTHPLLDRLPAAEAQAEILGSLDDLEREIGNVPRVFAYPGGGRDVNLEGILEREGFELAFSTERGTNDLRQGDWLRLRRINVGRASGLPLVRAQLLSSWRWPRPEPRRFTIPEQGSGSAVSVESDKLGVRDG